MKIFLAVAFTVIGTIAWMCLGAYMGWPVLLWWIPILGLMVVVVLWLLSYAGRIPRMFWKLPHNEIDTLLNGM